VPVQERKEPLPVEPVPTYQTPAEIKDVAEPIAEPKAAQIRKAGAAKGKAKRASAESEKPKAAAAKAKESRIRSSKRKGR
jgi:hypothetical protein